MLIARQSLEDSAFRGKAVERAGRLPTISEKWRFKHKDAVVNWQRLNSLLRSWDALRMLLEP
jgi:hypothetical protein